ncbi:MAG: glycoside hydrolase family 15 protein [Candidatus Nanohaloarchaea archaeon]
MVRMVDLEHENIVTGGEQGLLEWPHEPDENGLYPATLNDENDDMQHYWIRDNYFIYRAIGDERIPEAFAEIVDRHGEKIDAALEGDTVPAEDPLHIKYGRDLEEVNDEWGHFQIDSYAQMLEVLAENDYMDRAGKVHDYISEIDRFHWDEGPWENDHREEYAYSHAQVAKALQTYSEKGGNVPQEQIDFHVEKVHELAPQEDLHDLLILYDEPDFVDEELRDEILMSVEPLVGPHGVKRFRGDRWSGIHHYEEDREEPQWNFGHLLMYQVTGEDRYLKRQRQIREEHGGIPESMEDHGGEYRGNVNTPLLWAEALYFEAERDHAAEQADFMDRQSELPDVPGEAF